MTPLCPLLRSLVRGTPFVVAILRLGSPGGVFAADLRGRVRDESTLTPLYSANVKVQSQGNDSAVAQMITDAQGWFQKTELPDGLYHITVSFIGYTTVVRDSVVLGMGMNDTLDVQLVPHYIDMEAVIVTASRRPEKYEDAPTAAALVEGDEIRRTAALSHTDHLERLPATDAASTGVNSSNVVVRGFNNVLSTTLLSMEDYRLIQVPSLRVNAYQFSTNLDLDMERLELTTGPASALYGPNAASGVMHVITRSPFSSHGGVVSITGGERELRQVEARWAGSDHRLLGYRVTGQYYRARDWEYYDPKEKDTVTLFRQTADGNQYDSAPIDNRRDFEVEKWSAGLRGDMLLGSHGALVGDAGFSQASNIELADFGAAQIRDWSIGHFQLRANYDQLFVQGYVNFSDGGDSYLRRSGARIIDKSRLYVGQIQHGWKPWHFLHLNYGLDAQFTRPETEGTLHGKNEDRDEVNNFGGYAQADLNLSSKLNALAAGRVDYDNLQDDPVTSPRLALTYKAAEHQAFMVSYNRAFSTPATTEFFIDILAGVDTLPTSLVPYFGPIAAYTRAEGAVDGFHFSRGSDGRPNMVSLYGGLLVQDGSQSAANAYLSPDVNSVWRGMRLLMVGQQPGLDAALPESLSARVPGLFALAKDSGGYTPVSPASIQDLQPLSETGTTTLETGYKGKLGSRLAAGVNVYYTWKEDFVGPLQNQTPHVLIDSASFVNVLTSDIYGRTGDSALSRSTAEATYAEFKDLPIGLVSPESYQSATDVLVSRRNYGKVDLGGVDLTATWHAGPTWDLTGSYSYISKNYFHNVDGVSDLSVNAPRHKFGATLNYQSARRTISSLLNLRWVDGFPVRSGVYLGDVKRYMEVNLDLGYRFRSSTTITVSVQNVFDQRHAEFVGAPELGRLAEARLTQEFLGP